MYEALSLIQEECVSRLLMVTQNESRDETEIKDEAIIAALNKVCAERVPIASTSTLLGTVMSLIDVTLCEQTLDE